MRMSTLQWLQCGLVAAVIALVLFAILSRIGRKKEDPTPLWVTRTTFVLVAVLAVLVLAWAGVRNWYQEYGAFYDEAWREPGVEKYFNIKSDDTEALQAIYDADPEGFEYDNYRVVLVRLGCEDCEKVMPTIEALDALPEYYIVFSRSDIGKTFIEHYGLDFIPTVMYSGTAIELRTSVQQNEDDFDMDEFNSLVDELASAMQNDPDNPGTVAGIQAAEDAKNQETETEEP